MENMAENKLVLWRFSKNFYEFFLDLSGNI